jgi:hypothetical protein
MTVPAVLLGFLPCRQGSVRGQDEGKNQPEGADLLAAAQQAARNALARFEKPPKAAQAGCFASRVWS